MASSACRRTGLLKPCHPSDVLLVFLVGQGNQVTYLRQRQILRAVPIRKIQALHMEIPPPATQRQQEHMEEMNTDLYQEEASAR